jgi:coproporphyrinogen III oxidase-like Fe-S oxidoreductase
MLDENHFEILMNAIRKNFSFQNDIEITIEANPESINPSKAKFLKHLGI